jgi:hypothetical protein
VCREAGRKRFFLKRRGKTFSSFGFARRPGEKIRGGGE